MLHFIKTKINEWKKTLKGFFQLTMKALIRKRNETSWNSTKANTVEYSKLNCVIVIMLEISGRRLSKNVRLSGANLTFTTQFTSKTFLKTRKNILDTRKFVITAGLYRTYPAMNGIIKNKMIVHAETNQNCAKNAF